MAMGAIDPIFGYISGGERHLRPHEGSRHCYHLAGVLLWKCASRRAGGSEITTLPLIINPWEILVLVFGLLL